ncbi:MAG: hypothetical protein LBG70_01280, partial [Bifidobacteriaceae bacterium]|nr:hypothetical protein [Bifidobacteriaceae bacterium]
HEQPLTLPVKAAKVKTTRAKFQSSDQPGAPNRHQRHVANKPATVVSCHLFNQRATLGLVSAPGQAGKIG